MGQLLTMHRLNWLFGSKHRARMTVGCISIFIDFFLFSILLGAAIETEH